MAAQSIRKSGILRKGGAPERGTPRMRLNGFHLFSHSQSFAHYSEMDITGWDEQRINRSTGSVSIPPPFYNSPLDRIVIQRYNVCGEVFYMHRKIEQKYQHAPVMSIRLPAYQQTALRMIAKENTCTVSDIIRECVEDRLNAAGYHFVPEVTDGQMSMHDLA